MCLKNSAKKTESWLKMNFGHTRIAMDYTDRLASCNCNINTFSHDDKPLRKASARVVCKIM